MDAVRTGPAQGRQAVEMRARHGAECDTPGRPAGYIVGRCELALWGLSAVERLRRSLLRAGAHTVLDEDDPLPAAETVVVVRADYVFDTAVIEALTRSRGVLLVTEGAKGPIAVAAHVDAGQAREVAALLKSESLDTLPAPLDLVRAEGLTSAYRKGLRKREPAYVVRLVEGNMRAVEWRMFRGSYKGVTDFVTKWLWPVPAFWATRLAARWRIPPNAVTTAGLALVVTAFLLFLNGHFLWGSLAAWLMTFLDTVDGKLARLTLTSSRIGNIFDHGIDLAHPPFWYVAWGLGLVAGGRLPAYEDLSLLLAVVVGGYVLGRIVEGLFIWRFKMEIHVWRPIDSFFRLITARRNPNLALLTGAALMGRPDLGLVAVAGWTLVSLLFHGVRLLAALSARRRHAGLESWLATAP